MDDLLRCSPSRTILGFALVVLLFAGCGGPKPRDPRPNLLLVSLDTLRADHLSVYGYERDTSPFLQELAGRGLLFKHSFVNTHGTPPSHATLFTSMYQQTHRVSIDVMARQPVHHVPEDLRLLPEVLRDAGYATIGITAGGYMSENFGLSQGFEVFRADHVSVERGARTLLREIRRQIGQGKPIFAFFHTYEIHSPYDPPREHRERYGKYDSEFEPNNKNLRQFHRKADRLTSEDLAHVKALYDAGIRYTDDTLRDLFSELEEAGFFDHYLSVVTSDHGEEFGEHGGLLHPASLFEEILRVPLIINGTGIEAAVVDRLVSTVDVAPTLYGRAGVVAPEGVEGRDLLELDRGVPPDDEVVFAQYGDMVYGIRTRDFKLVENRRFGVTALFDLKQDPGETENVAEAHPEQLKALQERLDGWRERLQASHVQSGHTAPDIDEEQRRQLEALGYIH